MKKQETLTTSHPKNTKNQETPHPKTKKEHILNNPTSSKPLINKYNYQKKLIMLDSYKPEWAENVRDLENLKLIKPLDREIGESFHLVL